MYDYFRRIYFFHRENNYLRLLACQGPGCLFCFKASLFWLFAGWGGYCLVEVTKFDTTRPFLWWCVAMWGSKNHTKTIGCELPSLKLTARTWTWMVERLLSFLGWPMLVSIFTPILGGRLPIWNLFVPAVGSTTNVAAVWHDLSCVVQPMWRF